MPDQAEFDAHVPSVDLVPGLQVRARRSMGLADFDAQSPGTDWQGGAST